MNNGIRTFLIEKEVDGGMKEQYWIKGDSGLITKSMLEVFKNTE